MNYYIVFLHVYFEAFKLLNLGRKSILLLEKIKVEVEIYDLACWKIWSIVDVIVYDKKFACTLIMLQ